MCCASASESERLGDAGRRAHRRARPRGRARAPGKRAVAMNAVYWATADFASAPPYAGTKMCAEGAASLVFEG